MEVSTHFQTSVHCNGTPVKETGLIFSHEMSIANANLQKTMTRRGRGLKKYNQNPDEWDFKHMVDSQWWVKGESVEIINCPYGKVGDRIWMKETWAAIGEVDSEGYSCDYLYKSTYHDQGDLKIRWMSPLYMPRIASRFVGELTEVRLERLHQITEEDAQAEGACRAWSDGTDNYWIPEPETEQMVGVFATYRTGFESIWVSLYSKASWDSNPWVWVLKYQKV